MVWVKITDNYAEHPKHLKAGPLAQAMWLSGLAYANRLQTGGLVPRSKARQLVDLDGDGGIVLGGFAPGTILVANSMGEPVPVDWRYLADTLVNVGLWEVCQDGFLIHDYFDYQLTKERIAANREHGAQRQRASRARRKGEGVTP